MSLYQNEKLNPNEIKIRAAQFAKEFKTAHYERGESQSFYDSFWWVFGRKRRSYATYEEAVKKNDRKGFIDVFWPKWLIIEQKSEGRDLKKAMKQADEYCIGLEEEVQPRFILACDFQTFHLVDREERSECNFKLSEFPDYIQYFDFMRGLKQTKIKTEDPVNPKASEMMGKIHDLLKNNGYKEHNRVFLLTRLTYCLFADDTGIFNPPNILQLYLKNRTSTDGSDLGEKLIHLFQILNQSEDSRPNNLDEDLAKFSYINGNLFDGVIAIPSFGSEMRSLLINACEFNWSKVSPAIFGSLFQSVMSVNERRKKGGHYTDEENILKVIKPLFLDELYKEFEQIKSIKTKQRASELNKLQLKLSNLKFLDPACGSGNFLIITYQEIRRLELKIILEIHDQKIKRLDSSVLSKVDVNQFYGIEINEFSANIAKTALWMMDHLMNQELSLAYEGPYDRLPLKNHPNIINEDALEYDWNKLLPNSECSYVLGNPPFIGSKYQSSKQREQIKKLAESGTKGTLDYVSGWYLKAGQYVDAKTPIGFVSTNSITQGEQVSQLWPILFEKYGLNLIFAHQQFKWTSETRGKAGVTVIILGLSKDNRKEKNLYHNDDDGIVEHPNNISPYLFGSTISLPIVKKESKPINGLPKLSTGTQTIADGNYDFTDNEKKEFLLKEPNAQFLFRPLVGADEFLHGKTKWLLNFYDVEPSKLRNLIETQKRIALVKAYRLKSKRKATVTLAETPKEFQIKQFPDTPFLVIPEHSSEKREYIPMGYLEPPIIPTHKVRFIPNASIELFGLLMSKMHMVWNNVVGGKLETRNIYTIQIVYNTFPLPDTKFDSLKPYAEKILNVRKKYPNSSLHDMYAENIMPSDLKKAHLNLDRAVEKLYRKEPFNSDNERIVFLLTKYEEMMDKK